MPRSRATQASTNVVTAPVRESPRKRKRNQDGTDDGLVEAGSQLIPAVVEVDLPASKLTKGANRKQSKTAVPISGETSERNQPNPRIPTTKQRRSEVSTRKTRIKQRKSDAPSSEPGRDHTAEALVKKPSTSSRETVSGKQDKLDENQDLKPAPKKRKTKEEKEAEAMPLAPRTTGLKMFVGAHVSIAKGVENAVTNSLHIGGNAFALFLKSQRKWDNPALKAENRDAFRDRCHEHHYDSMSHVVPHGSYLVNLATPDKDKAKQSYETFLDDLRRCEALGIKYYNFHPGTTNQEPLPEAIARLTANLNRALAETSTVVPLLENMAGGGSVIGSRFTDLRDIIALIKPEFQSRIGICIDTCHTLAAGYDLRTPEAYQKTFQELDDVVGLKYIKALHMNDSKAPLGSKRDLHQNIGLGFLGLRAFHNIMNDARLQNVPLVLETPTDRPDSKDPTGKKTIENKQIWASEIKLLESLIGMDPEGPVFKKIEAELSEQGRAEREKMMIAVNAKEEKAQKKIDKERAKGQPSVADMFGSKGSRTKKRKSSVGSASSLSDPGDSTP